MPTPAYVWFKDDQGSEIKGSVQIAGREGSCEVMEFAHNLHIPTDPHNGRLTGVRMHSPVTLVKSYDAASPYLYKACCEGQTLKEVVIKWYTIDDTGTEKEYFIHKLEDAKVASMKAHMPNTKDPEKERYVHLEEVALVYSKITWTYPDGSLEYVDSWTAQK
jgi:type VI secretion system secreted protein Hcp